MKIQARLSNKRCLSKIKIKYWAIEKGHLLTMRTLADGPASCASSRGASRSACREIKLQLWDEIQCSKTSEWWKTHKLTSYGAEETGALSSRIPWDRTNDAEQRDFTLRIVQNHSRLLLDAPRTESLANCLPRAILTCQRRRSLKFTTNLCVDENILLLWHPFVWPQAWKSES